MTFSERMKELFDQGAQVSKEIASRAGVKAQDWSEKGYQASKDFLSKAGAKVQDLGERGVLMVEIKQLEGQAQKQLNRLGTEVYRIFVEQGDTTLAADAPEIRFMISEVTRLRDEIEKRDRELESRNNRGTGE